MSEYTLFIIALLPIIWLIISLGALKLPAHKTCSVTFAATFVLAVLVWS